MAPKVARPAAPHACSSHDWSNTFKHAARAEPLVLQDGMLALWKAALRGDAPTVKRLLVKHAIPRDTPHPDTGMFLILEVAGKRTAVEKEDQQLRDVLEALVLAGWDPAVQYLAGREDNALHLLAAQQPCFRIVQRARLLVDVQAAKPAAANMLNTRNADGRLPDEVAAAHRPEIGMYLHAKKEQIAQTCRAA